MAVLTWKDVNFNPIDTDGSAASIALMNQGLGSMRDSLTKLRDEQSKKAGLAGIADALKYGTAEEFQAARMRGDLQLTPSNVDALLKREQDLLGHEQTVVQTEGFRLNNQGQVIDNEGKVINNEKLRQELAEKTYDFGIKQDTDTAQLEVADVLAQIAAESHKGTREGLANANALAVANAKLIMRAGRNAVDALSNIDGIFDGTIKNIADGIGAEEAFVAAGNKAATAAFEAEGRTLFKGVDENNHFKDPQAAINAVSLGKGSPQAKAFAINLITENQATMWPKVNAEDYVLDQSLTEGFTPSPDTPPAFNTGRGPNKGTFDDLFSGNTPFNNAKASELTIGQFNELITPKEKPKLPPGVGEESPSIPIDTGSYTGASTGFDGAFVEPGSPIPLTVPTTPATPTTPAGSATAAISAATAAAPVPVEMGMYGIGQSSINEAAKDLGFNSETVLDADTQTKIFQHIADKRLAGASTMQGKMNALRKEWKNLSFDKVSDNALATAIASYENGDRSALGAILDTDPAFRNRAATDIDALERGITDALNSANIPNAQIHQTMLDIAAERSAYANEVLQDMAIDGVFGQNRANILAALTNPKTVSVGERPKMVLDAFNQASPDIPNGTDTKDREASYAAFDTEVRYVESQLGLNFPEALEIVKGSMGESSWWEIWKDEQYVDHKMVDKYMNSVFNMKEKDPKKRLQGGREELAIQAFKAAGAEDLQKLQAAYDQAQADYFNAANRAKNGYPVDYRTLGKRAVAIGEMLENKIRALDNNPAARASMAAVPAR